MEVGFELAERRKRQALEATHCRSQRFATGYKDATEHGIFQKRPVVWSGFA